VDQHENRRFQGRSVQDSVERHEVDAKKLSNDPVCLITQNWIHIAE
jgi:hypothetical protein